MKFSIVLSVILALSLSGCSEEPDRSAGKLVEITLVDKLDEPRGYCLDIAGGKGKRAPIDKGLQAHTCYNYTGAILEDQGFDAKLINNGTFRIAYFDACMMVKSVSVDEPIALEPCKDAQQQFELTSEGQLVPKADSKLCITVNSEKKREGRGGTPVHVMRPLSLQPCDVGKKALQTWALRSL